MFKKLLIYSLLISPFFSEGLLLASDVGSETSHSSSSNVSKSDTSKGSNFRGKVSTFIIKQAFSGNPIFVYTAGGAAALISAYGGYQLWRKFIFDEQLRAIRDELRNETIRSTHVLQNEMIRSTQELRGETQRLEQKLSAEIIRSSQDTNRNITHEVKESEHRQMQHQDAQLQLLSSNFEQHINLAEARLANDCREIRGLITHLRDNHGLQLLAIKTTVADTQRSIASLGEQQHTRMIAIETSSARIIALLESLDKRAEVLKLNKDQDERASVVAADRLMIDASNKNEISSRSLRLLTFFGNANFDKTSSAAPANHSRLALPSSASSSSCQ